MNNSDKAEEARQENISRNNRSQMAPHEFSVPGNAIVYGILTELSLDNLDFVQSSMERAIAHGYGETETVIAEQRIIIARCKAEIERSPHYE